MESKTISSFMYVHVAIKQNIGRGWLYIVSLTSLQLITTQSTKTAHKIKTCDDETQEPLHLSVLILVRFITSLILMLLICYFLWKFQAKVMSSNWSLYWILHHTDMGSSFVSSFQVKKKQFFKNFTTILLFGVVGTVISFCLISLGKIHNHSSTSTICLFQAWYCYFLKIIQW